MKQVITTEKVPIKLWLDDIEEGALKQAKNLANLPFVFKWVSIMPDSHQGYGMPIGGVLATRGIVIPNAVGVDIGCGVVAFNTEIKGIDIDTLKRIMGRVREEIPVGFNHRSEVSEKMMPQFLEGQFVEYPMDPICRQEFKNARTQLGTLGGGKMIASRPRV